MSRNLSKQPRRGGRKIAPPFKVGREAFILPVALALAALIAGIVIFCGGLLRHNLAAPTRALALARANALYGLDAALAQLQSVAAADTTATAPAALARTGFPNAAWVGAWPATSPAPTWLVSGAPDSPASFSDPFAFPSGITAPLVTLDSSAPNKSENSYAYYIEDLSLRATVKNDLVPSSQNILKQQTIFVPQTSVIPAEKFSSETTPISYGLLTNPLNGGLKTDLDSPVSLSSNSASDSSDPVAAINHWRSPSTLNDQILSRPLVFPEVTLLMGLFNSGDSDRTGQLALDFFATAWNPTAAPLSLFTPEGKPDFQLRVLTTSTIRIADDTSAINNMSAAPVAQINLTEHTNTFPVLGDIFTAMDPGEMRYITHYRLAPLQSQFFQPPPSDYFNLHVTEGDWSFIIETLPTADTPSVVLQTIGPFHLGQFDSPAPVPYTVMTVNAHDASAQNLTPSNAQFALHFTLKDLATASTSELRTGTLPTTAYTCDTSAVLANSFAGAPRILFDAPDASSSLVSVGALNSMSYLGSPPLSLGSKAAGDMNQLFDQYYFSSDSSIESFTPTNANLRKTIPPMPSGSNLSTPSPYYFLQGAFNINSLSAEAWASLLVGDVYNYPFRSVVPAHTVLPKTTAISIDAAALVAHIASRSTPYRSLSELADDSDSTKIPAPVFCRLSALLQPRGDTFVIHVIGLGPGGVPASLAATVQRVISPIDPSLRRFQILSHSWVQ